MLDEKYFLTAGNLGQFIERMKEVLGRSTVTIRVPGGFLKVACTIRGVQKLYGGVVYEEVSDAGDVISRQIQYFQLAPDATDVHQGRPRVYVHLHANTLTMTVYDGTANLPAQYMYIANREPEK